MAARPPGPGAPGLPPGGPPPIPGGAPPPQPPPPPAPGPPSGALGAGSPLGTIYTDLSVHMSHGWQMADLAVRCLHTALKTPEFQKTELGKVNAVLRHTAKTVETLIAHYTSGNKGGAPATSSSEGEEDGGDSGTVNSTDADAAPESGALQ